MLVEQPLMFKNVLGDQGNSWFWMCEREVKLVIVKCFGILPSFLETTHSVGTLDHLVLLLYRGA